MKTRLSIKLIFCFVFLTAMSCGEVDKQRNFESHKKEFNELIVFYKEIVPKDKIIEIEFYDNTNLQRFQITDIDTIWVKKDSFYLSSSPLYFEWEIKIDNIPDSILSEINWTRQTFDMLKTKLDNANCISINNENPIIIDYKRDFFGEFTYHIYSDYDSAKMKEVKSKRNDLHFFCDSVAWSYDTGAL
ncbi:MAG TPA: hypothetical protein VFK73_00330 [Paludibacter sp.]|nr:hypothetical protein [Paludibacter sp.]